MQYLNYIYRFLATAFSFSIFGIGALIIAFLIFPVIKIIFVKNESRKDTALRYILKTSWQFFIFIISFLRLIKVNLKDANKLKNIKGNVIVANHPTLIDVVILISKIPNSNCVVKESLGRNFFVRGIVNNIYILNSLDPEKLLNDCKKSLDKGNNLIIFPEGGRTNPKKKSRVSKGAAHIALFSKADILPIRIDCEPLGLLKGQKWYHVTKKKLSYQLHTKDILNVDCYLKSQDSNHKRVRLITEELIKRLNIN